MKRTRALRNRRWPLLVAALASSVMATAIGLNVFSSSSKTSSPIAQPEASQGQRMSLQPTSVTWPDQPLNDDQLRAVVDDLLAEISPGREQNGYFSEFARSQLEWMEQEARAGRLTVGLFTDPASVGLLPGVLMVATAVDSIPTILVVKPRFLEFLEKSGRITKPFTAQQRNDFAIGIVHEVVHLRESPTIARDQETFSEEELKTWRTVNLRVVRPLREQGRPVDQQFALVDDLLRGCDDSLPCPLLSRLLHVSQ